MTKYRKKPVVIDAWQLAKENVEAGIPDWIDLDTVHIFDGGVLFAEIVTLEGVMQAKATTSSKVYKVSSTRVNQTFLNRPMR